MRAQRAIEKLRGREFTSGDLATFLDINEDVAKDLCISLVRLRLAESTLRYCVKGVTIFRLREFE